MKVIIQLGLLFPYKYKHFRGEHVLTQAGLVRRNNAVVNTWSDGCVSLPQIQMQNDATEQRVTDLHIIRSNKFSEGLSLSHFLINKAQST